MLQDTNDIRQTFLDKMIHSLFIVHDKNTGESKIRNLPFARRIILQYSKRKYKRLKRVSYKFKLDTIIQYPKEFADKHRDINPPFVININKDQEIDLQIIHPCMLEEVERKNTKAFGFTIHLPFDTTQQEARSELDKFRKSSFHSQFLNISNDGMEDYILDCEENYDLLDRMIKKVLKELKGFKESDEIIIDHFFLVINC